MQNKYTYFFSLLRTARRAGLDITKDDLVKTITRDSSPHLSDLSIYELQALEEDLRQMIARQLFGSGPAPVAPPGMYW